jgi:hypothetical protein
LSCQSGGRQQKSWKLEDFFIVTGFYDLLPVAMELAENLGYDENEMSDAVCKVISSSSTHQNSLV